MTDKLMGRGPRVFLKGIIIKIQARTHGLSAPLFQLIFRLFLLYFFFSELLVYCTCT